MTASGSVTLETVPGDEVVFGERCGAGCQPAKAARLALFGPVSSSGSSPQPLPFLAPTRTTTNNVAMPIAPITGKLRKRLWMDLSVAMGLGIASAYAFWFVSLSFFTVTHKSNSTMQVRYSPQAR